MNFKTNMITSTLLAAGFSLLAGSAAAQTCVANNCAALGFTKSEDNCEGDIIRCPFDTSKVFCKEKIANVIVPGAILYSDGTIRENEIAGKTPVGIVAYVNGSTRFAVSLTELSVPWSSENEDVPCLTNVNESEAKKDMNGRTNTMCLDDHGYSSDYDYPAVDYCTGHKPVSSGTGSDGWYLPAAGELIAMSSNYSVINRGLQKLNETQISSNYVSSRLPGYYWSSSESNYYGAWFVRLSNGKLGDSDRLKTNYKQVRCILAF